MAGGLVRQSGISASMWQGGGGCFGAGAVPCPQISDRLGYIMLLREVPGQVTEEGFQEAGRRMLNRQGHQEMRARGLRVHRASALLRTWTMVILPQSPGR